MDSQLLLKQFEEIEGKVENLISGFRALESENTELKSKIERLEGDLQGKAEQENQFNREKDQIRDRIGNLLGRLDEAGGE